MAVYTENFTILPLPLPTASQHSRQQASSTVTVFPIIQFVVGVPSVYTAKSVLILFLQLV